ncbi:XRE family transcriptional regulator [Raineyella fluvialis]|uniref:ImmA/IrrE family metallo-endopeptidase n=1 Tax=Raineyella fluvialis TaxID=2662261 RepID=A0A5Q2F8X2_9ACTN|nr:XRE family transcriptional regulator [Raineyella fluvialis]QGF23128.1 ImmA/IrrE family metallo-endopeptidase [Raineyella fluvialis]
MPSISAYVKPELLKWARTSANIQPIAAARKIGVPEDLIAAWEAGQKRPTITQLRKATTVYRRPLAVFYLPEPPEGYETLRNFRRLGPSQSGGWSTALHGEYRRAHFQRDVLLELAELDQERPPSDWRLSQLRGTDEQLAESVRRRLMSLVDLKVPTASSDEYSHLGYWTRALEDAGVLVMSTQGGLVSVEEMRAFSLYFDEVPVIMLNGADAPRGRLFSLLHEYMHLLLHTEGLCDMTTDQYAVTEDRRLEARCNALAAEILMPRESVLGSVLVRQHHPGDPWILGDLIEAARPFGVSVEALLRRLVTLQQVSLADYQAFREAQQGSAAVKKRPSGGSFYFTKARDLGKGYVRTVAGAHRRSLIDSTTAAEYLDAKVGQIARLAEVSGS